MFQDAADPRRMDFFRSGLLKCGFVERERFGSKSINKRLHGYFNAVAEDASATIEHRQTWESPQLDPEESCLTAGPLAEQNIRMRIDTEIGMTLLKGVLGDAARYDKPQFTIIRSSNRMDREPIGSTNSTFLNGRPLLAAHFLKDGDRLSVGNAKRGNSTGDMFFRCAAPSDHC